MELKVDESVLKKLEDVNLNRGNSNSNLNNLNNPNNTNFNSKKLSFNFNKISKFFDYANKFGVIYFVNNTHIGICFNDNSNILKNFSLDSKKEFTTGGSTFQNNNLERKLSDAKMNNIINNKNFHYLYVDRDGNPNNYDEATFENLLTSHSVTKELNKKFEIFKHILAKYTQEILALNDPNKSSNSMFYVKKFIKVQHAVLFRLSNKLIQVCFVDKTELIMSTESSEFYFRNKNGEEIQDSIQSVMNSENSELIKRIKFSKNLLIHFVKNQKTKKILK
jgi:polo-like kinase 1